jgi:predicted  nucleic acid-binding Zn-ribbon protein
VGEIVLSEIKQLLDLQQIDEKLQELDSHIRHLQGHCAQLEEKAEQERVRVGALKEQLRQLEHDSRMRTLQVDELDQNIRAYQKRLDEGIISFKEMEDLREKIASERSRIGRMEDEALQMMDGIESSRAELEEAQNHLSEREAQIRCQIDEAKGEIRATEQDVAGFQARREEATSALGPYLAGQYESLRAKFANPVATIEHGTCAGCKLRVSGNTVERARGSMGIVTCEHCSRILYMP